MTEQNDTLAPEEKQEAPVATAATEQSHEGATTKEAAADEVAAAPSAEEINWRRFREERAQERKAAEETARLAAAKESELRALQATLATITAANGSAPMTEHEQNKMIADLVDEDIPTGGEVKSFLKKYVPNIVSSILKQQEDAQAAQRKQQEAQAVPSRLKETHPDFNEVVHRENLDYLDYHFPEISGALAQLPEGFDKWSRIYKTVSRLVPKQGRNDEKRIATNLSKPQSIAGGSSGSSEEGYGPRLTETKKAENYRRLLELARS